MNLVFTLGDKYHDLPRNYIGKQTPALPGWAGVNGDSGAIIERSAFSAVAAGLKQISPTKEFFRGEI